MVRGIFRSVIKRAPGIGFRPGWGVYTDAMSNPTETYVYTIHYNFLSNRVGWIPKTLTLMSEDELNYQIRRLIPKIVQGRAIIKRVERIAMSGGV